MKIQCNGCDEAEAKVFCCADEAALCLGCDEKIHSVNKLVGKHQRVSLSTSSSPLPKCDICQEAFGYFICLEDRAIFCRRCDVSIHSVNSFVRNHMKFLFSGIRVGLESPRVDTSSSKEKGHSTKAISAQHSMSRTATDSSTNITPVCAKDHPTVAEGKRVDTQLNPTVVDPQTASKNSTDWRIKDILELIDSSSTANPSSQEGLLKVTEGKGLENSEWLNILRSAEEELLNDTSQKTDDISWIVPQYSISGSSSSSRETAKVSSGNNVHNIPDIGNAVIGVENFQFCQSPPINAKLSSRSKHKP